jgi:hypothetical protein
VSLFEADMRAKREVVRERKKLDVVAEFFF